MLSLIAKRLLLAVPTLLVLATLGFFLVHAAPGGPFDRARLASPAVEQALAAAYHLDQPLPVQYLHWLGGVVRGDLGPSFRYDGVRVGELIAAGLPVSAGLGAAALLLAVPLGVGLGLFAALHRGAPAERAAGALTLLALSVPNFVLAPLLVLLFAVGAGWLPAGGWDGWRSGVLPVLALALPIAAMAARLMRASTADVLEQPFIRTARAKGLPASAVLLRHALRPALLPVVAWLGPAAAGVLTGSVVVEQAFALPGIGRYFVQGALDRDYTLVLGVVLVYGALIVLCNLAADVLHAALDPRLRQA
ncbi:MAG TPA: ABC transporter permease [Candidatus Binatia bacterium]|nr:ABC transporter permease [Candidatus Binatia bacterium]